MNQGNNDYTIEELDAGLSEQANGTYVEIATGKIWCWANTGEKPLTLIREPVTWDAAQYHLSILNKSFDGETLFRIPNFDELKMFLRKAHRLESFDDLVNTWFWSSERISRVRMPSSEPTTLFDEHLILGGTLFKDPLKAFIIFVEA